VNQCVIVYNNKILRKNCIYLFVCAHIWLCMTCIQGIDILFMNFCLCAYLYISLCIDGPPTYECCFEVVLFLCFVLWLLFASRHSHTQRYKQTMNRTKHTWTVTDLFWIGINLMFDFGISLLMWIIIPMQCTLIFSHVCTWSFYMLSSNHFNVWFRHSLFMLNMCNSIIGYFDCSHVCIEFLCFHTCLSW